MRVPKDYANLRRGQTLPGELAHVLGDLTRVDLQPRRRRPPVRQSRLRDTLPVGSKESRRAKPEARKLTSTHTPGGSVRRAHAGCQEQGSKTSRPRSCQLWLQTWPAGRRSAHSGTHPLLCMRPMVTAKVASACEAVHGVTRVSKTRRRVRGGKHRTFSLPPLLPLSPWHPRGVRIPIDVSQSSARSTARGRDGW